MTKKQPSFNHVTPELLKEVERVIASAAKHKYSVSQVYNTHNAVYSLNEQHQSCPACLEKRANNLKRDYDKIAARGAFPGSTAQSTNGPLTKEATDELYVNYLKENGLEVDENSEAPASPIERMRLVKLTHTFLAAHGDEISKEYADTVLNNVSNWLATSEGVYANLVDRIGLNIDGGAESEAATLCTVLEPGYPVAISDEERAVVLTRFNALTAPPATDFDPARDQDLTEGERTNVEPQYLYPDAPGFVAPAEGVTRYSLGEEFIPIDFTPGEDDVTKGTVLYADGDKVKAGTYNSDSGIAIAVQPGGKATIKEDI